MRTRLFCIVLLLGLGFCLPAMALDRINVTDYGAVPNDGHDDAPAINAAFDHGQCLYFPAGTYNYSGSMILMGTLADKSFRLYGDGPGVSTIIFTNAYAGGINAPLMGSHTLEVDGLTLQANSNNSGTAISAAFHQDGATDKVRSANIHNVQLIGSEAGFWNGGISLDRAPNAVIDKVEIIGRMNNQAYGDPPGTAFGIQWVSSGAYKTEGLQLSNLMIWWCNTALKTSGSVNGLYLNGFEFAFCGQYGVPVIDLISSTPDLGSGAFHLVNGHMNTMQQGIRLTNLRGVKVSKVFFIHLSLAYADQCGPQHPPPCNTIPWAGSGDDLRLNSCTDAVLSDNSFIGVNSDISEENGIFLNESHSVQIIGNYFTQFKSNSVNDACIRADSTSTTVRIINNIFETDANVANRPRSAYEAFGVTGSLVPDGGYGGVGRAYWVDAPFTYYRGNTVEP